MKKNFLIMMIMLLCSGFAFAQINTVRGFVPGAGTGAGNNDQTYAVFGQMFGDIDENAANPYEVAEGLGQAQLIADTVEAVVGCGDSLIIDEFTLSVAAIQTIVNEFAADPTRPRDTFLTIQHPNAAIYNYDKLLVLHLFVCPCTIKDADTHEYEVVAIDNICWTKTNMRATTTCGGIDVVTKSYSTDVTPELNDSIFGLLYTWENASKASKCDSNYVTGICPCGWHLPTAAEVDTILNSYTNDLRSNGGYWVVPQGITNLTKFTAEPAGYFDSLATRFEGFHSEADFWYVATDSTCDANYFQIYYFCDKPKQEHRNVAMDAMSVRCVLDMIYDYHKDDPTPNPQPTPPTCPTIGTVTQNGDQGYYFDVNNLDFSKIDDITIDYVAVFVSHINPEIEPAEVTGTDYYNNGQGHVEYSNWGDGDDYQFGWFFREEPDENLDDPEDYWVLLSLNTTATILYDGQICTGYVSKEIPVELEPEQEECDECNALIQSVNMINDFIGVEGNITNLQECSSTTVNITCIGYGDQDVEETLFDGIVYLDGGDFSWTLEGYTQESLSADFNVIVINVSYQESSSCDVQSTEENPVVYSFN